MQNLSGRIASNGIMGTLTEEIMNMKSAVIVIGFILTSAVIGFGQTRTVTNFELEKYQQRRIAAEEEYRDNYKRLGLPSPEELDKQRDEDLKAKIALADQLRQARLEKERLDLERRSLDIQASQQAEDSIVYESDGYYGGAYLGGYSTYGGRIRNGRFRGRIYNQGGGYRVTPFQVIPQPVQPRPQRMIRREPRHR